MKSSVHQLLSLLLLLLFALTSGCRKDELVVPTEYELLPIAENPDATIVGMYLLNEGNMGSNKSSLDFLDFRTGFYARNIYAERNPRVVKELGDVGNDVKIYGSKLWAVINCSHKVEVMDARTAVRIAQIDIPNCRYIAFRRGKAYVTSYVGPVSLDPNAPLGAVYEIDTGTLAVERQVVVGYQPDELVIVGEYMYVANSGGYRVPNYDYTLSVIEIEGFKQIAKIPVAINLHRIRADRYGKLWVSSRGNYNDVPSNLYVLERPSLFAEYRVTDTLNIPCSNMALKGDSLYLYSVEWSYVSNSNSVSYAIINVKSKEVVSRSFITDGTEKDIEIPYGIAIHPETGEIFVTDAKNYVSSGQLHCFSPDGRRRWSVRTGDIPAHMVFLPK